MSRFPSASVLLIVALLIPAASSIASAGSWIDFASAGAAPTPFQIKRAKAEGKDLKTVPGVPLRGLLARPEGVGPFAAVVLLHGCDGIRQYQIAWLDLLAERGFVALLVDSFGSRQTKETCSKSEMGGADLANDAFGALAYLKEQPFIDSAHVGVMGWGLGGEVALTAVNDMGWGHVFGDRFMAAAALYAGMDAEARFGAPVLLLLAGAANNTSSTERFVKASVLASKPITIKVYPEALPYFDDPERGPKFIAADVYNPRSPTGKGDVWGYNKEAASDAVVQVTTFLIADLK